MTPKQLIKKKLHFWYRAYYGGVTPMMRVYKNKKQREVEATDYNLLGLEPIIKEHIKSGQFKLIKNKNPKRYDVLDLSQARKRLFIFWYYTTADVEDKTVDYFWSTGGEGQAWEEFLAYMEKEEKQEVEDWSYDEVYEVEDARQFKQAIN